MSETPEILTTAKEEADDWDNVVCLPIIDISKHHLLQQQESSSAENILSSSGSTDPLQQQSNFCTVQSLTEYIAGVDISRQLPKIKGDVAPRKGNFHRRVLHLFGVLFNSCRRQGGGSVQASSLKADRDRIFALAMLTFDHQNSVHSACLYTVYAKLTGNVVNGRRRFGQHWEEIGFQGSDPSTDFRGVGLLGLLQLTFFTVTPEVRRLCRAAYEVSLDARQHYPFAIMGMNISQIALQVLREGLLSGMIRSQSRELSVLEVFNRFYFGVWAAFHEVWTAGEGKTILDMGYVLKDLRVFVRRNVNKLVSEYAAFKTSSKQSSAANHSYQEGKYDDDQADFTNIGNI